MNFIYYRILERIVFIIYIWVITITIGGIISTGVISANVIFNANDFGVNINSFQSGILMTQIFIRLNNLFMVAIICICLYEIIALRLHINTVLKSILFVSALCSVICIILFVFYYTPFIVEQQQIGDTATSTNKFKDIHLQSELVAKIIFLTLNVNAIIRLMYRK